MATRSRSGTTCHLDLGRSLGQVDELVARTKYCNECLSKSDTTMHFVDVAGVVDLGCQTQVQERVRVAVGAHWDAGPCGAGYAGLGMQDRGGGVPRTVDAGPAPPLHGPW